MSEEMKIKVVDERDFINSHVALEYVDWVMGGGFVCSMALVDGMYLVKVMEVIE